MITTQSTVKNTSSKRRGSVQKNLYEPTLYNGLSVLQECHVPNKMHVYAAPPNSDWKQGFVEMFPRWLQNYLPDVNVKVTILCLAWYVTSSISSNLSKSILREFPHPVGLTELQFLTNALLCLFFIIVVNHFHHQDLKSTWVSKNLRNFPEGVLPIYLSGNFQECILQRFLTLDRLALVNTFPMGIFQFFGHVTSYKATSMIPVSLVHSVKSLSPIITLCWYRFVKKKHFYPMTYYTLIPLIAGVILTSSSSGSKKYSSVASDSSATGSWTLVGLLFAAVSMTIFVSQNIFAKSILTVKKRELLPSQKNVPLKASSPSTPYNLDKITILFYCSCIGFVLTLPLFITRELLASASVFGDFTAHVVYLVAIYGLTHFLQAMLAFQLIGMLSPVNYSIANIMKRIVVIGVALIWESRLSSRQILGLSMTILGLYGYDKWGNRPSNSE